MTDKPTHHQANIHLLNAFQLDEIAQLLTLAFKTGSGLSQICHAKGEELHRRLRFLFQTVLPIQAAANQPMLSVTKEAQVTGVAVIQEPESNIPLALQLQGFLKVSLGVSPIVAWHLWQNMRILEQFHPSEPHYYLIFLGIHPNFQGRGYARILLDTLHARSESHPLSKGVYLETSNPHNVSFYKYFGYQLITQVNIKGVETFVMFRPNSI